MTPASALLPIALQAPSRDAIAVAADIASIVIAVAVLVVTVLAGLLFLRVRRILGEVRAGVHHSLGPVSDRARAITDNVEFVTQVVRSDVESLNVSVKSLSERLKQASDRMEERIEEFNALMEVVQDEAENLFLDTASTVRGVREGARAITSGGERRPRAEAEEAPPRRSPPAAPPRPSWGDRHALAPAEEGDGRSAGEG